MRYVTALEVAPSTAGAMSATTHLVSGDGRMEGIMLGDMVPLAEKQHAQSVLGDDILLLHRGRERDPLPDRTGADIGTTR